MDGSGPAQIKKREKPGLLSHQSAQPDPTGSAQMVGQGLAYIKIKI